MAKPGPKHGYRKEMCEMVVEYSRHGLSLVEIACKLDITRPTMYRWKKEIPEFGQAIERAETNSQAWWEEALRTGKVGTGPGQVHPSGWKHSMDCRFGHDYGNKLDLTNSDGNFTPPEVVYVVGVEPDGSSDSN